MSRLQILLLSGFVCFTSRIAISGDRIDLTPGNELGQLTHVSIQLEAGGHNLIRSQQTQSQQPQDDKAGNEQKQPISVVGQIGLRRKATHRRRQPLLGRPSPFATTTRLRPSSKLTKPAAHRNWPTTSERSSWNKAHSARWRIAQTDRCRASSSTSSTWSAIDQHRPPAAKRAGSRRRILGERRHGDGSSADIRHRRRLRSSKYSG